MTIGTPSNWSRSNSELLKAFLETGTGELFIAHVAYARPGLASDSVDLNTVALRAQICAGYEKAFNTMLSLAVPPSEDQKRTPDYPDLDRPPEPGEEVP